MCSEKMHKDKEMDVVDIGSLNDCRAFNTFVQNVFLKSPLQRKYLLKHFEQRDELFWERAEEFSKKFLSCLPKLKLTVDDAVDSYLKMCNDMLLEQIKFKKTGLYSCQKAQHAYQSVYLSKDRMMSYMVGLAVSQFLWPNHYRMYDFFIQESQGLLGVNSYLEIGPGHSLYLVQSVYHFPRAFFAAVDISPTSKRISETLLAHFTETATCEFLLGDFMKIDKLSRGEFDYIVMGEVLEHLDNPTHALRRMHDLLNEEGHVFITTCANAPAIDHVYLYESVEHIKQDIQEAGFKIVSDLSLPVEDLPQEEWAKQKTEINYAALLTKRT